MSKLLEVRDLCKSYESGDQRLEILSGLSLDVDEGDMIGITGVSGSGKSTLLHLIGGMDKPDRGSIRILDKRAVRPDPRRSSPISATKPSDLSSSSTICCPSLRRWKTS